MVIATLTNLKDLLMVNDTVPPIPLWDNGSSILSVLDQPARTLLTLHKLYLAKVLVTARHVLLPAWSSARYVS